MNQGKVIDNPVVHLILKGNIIKSGLENVLYHTFQLFNPIIDEKDKNPFS